MCGIAGLFRLQGCGEDDAVCVRRMNDLQRHRGPDDQGVLVDPFCVLGHRRLAIIDLSSAGKQPFTSSCGRYHLVFNGEIYNYLELRKELERDHGCKFHTRTDTEVLLQAFICLGQDCLQRFNGMFAFVIYDTLKRRLFMARDRVGIKPLYYYYDNLRQELFFASELKALLSCEAIRPTINQQSLFEYLIFNRTDIGQQTFVNEIKRLTKGHCAVVDHHGMRSSCWWDPEDYAKICRETDSTKIIYTIDKLLQEAVSLRMRSDVPVGSCLSGGLDSSIITGILFQEELASSHYKTFTASFPGHSIDETHFVDGLQQRYPFDNHRTFPNAAMALKNLEEFVYANDEPTTSPSFFSQYEVMRLAREHDVPVLLDGQGGDEIFAGYQYFHGFYLYGLLKTGEKKRFCNELLRSLQRRQHHSAYQVLLFQMIPRKLKKKLLMRAVPYVRQDFFDQFIDESLIFNGFFEVEGLNQSLLRHFQYKLEHLLRMEDRNSMAFSIEARVPYLDCNLIEFIMGLPEDLKIKNGETKCLQKMAVGHYTTDEILQRLDKIGFGTPGEEWMLSPAWQEATVCNYKEIQSIWPDVFNPDSDLPVKGVDRWKINQLATWNRLFLS